MAAKTYLVTGGNTGIGKAIASELARQGRRVAIVSRDPAKGAAAVDEIRAASGNQHISLIPGDLGSIAGANRLADRILDECPDLGALINNAGVWMTERVITADGLELSFMVNHLAPVILSTRLLDRLRANAPARIVAVNAGLYPQGRLDLARTPYGQDFRRMGTYATTKLFNVLAMLELARQVEGSGVTVNLIHPGVIRTQLGASSGPLGALLRLAKRFWKTPEEGARGPVRLATAPELEMVNGQYFNECEPIPLAEIAQDRLLSRQVWQQAIELTRG
ncbi:MAG TPA: SDR family NAD(P)-dependent oxidoreductase [Herpetosiphonaceae bacterium]|nr:SDR family NAD(P)-dependent oxidoreductase [Herpetosiphonaceae bacterium]